MDEKRYMHTLIIGGTFFIAILLVVMISLIIPTHTPAAEEEAPIIVEEQNTFADLALVADAAVVYDLKKSEVLFAQNAYAQLPLASLTKLFSVYIALRDLDREGSVVIAPQDLAPEGDSGLMVGETWRIEDLAAFTLMTSSNDGAATLTRRLEQNYNMPASALLSSEALHADLPQTYFLNGTGLDTSPEVSGGYGSAYDVTQLLGHLHADMPEFFERTSKARETFYSQDGFVHVGENTNEIANTLPQLIGAKTGYTDLAGGNLAVLIEVAPNHPVAIVVLGSTRTARFLDVETLVEKTLTHFSQ